MGIVKVESGKSPVVKTIKLSTDEIGSIVEDSDSSLWILRVDGPIAHIKNKLKGFESGFGSDNIQIDNYTEVGGLPGSYWSLFSFEEGFCSARIKEFISLIVKTNHSYLIQYLVRSLLLPNTLFHL